MKQETRKIRERNKKFRDDMFKKYTLEKYIANEIIYSKFLKKGDTVYLARPESTYEAMVKSVNNGIAIFECRKITSIKDGKPTTSDHNEIYELSKGDSRFYKSFEYAIIKALCMAAEANSNTIGMGEIHRLLHDRVGEKPELCYSHNVSYAQFASIRDMHIKLMLPRQLEMVDYADKK